MSSSEKLSIVVGVTGGIAAYKACHVIRAFTEAGHSVRVVPTRNALKFVGAATFEALSGNPVATDVFEHVDKVQHVMVGQQADLVVVVPATADFLARLRAGMADDQLSATCLVATCPVVVAPAMHTEMWNNPATRENVAVLRERGIAVMEPAHGRLTGRDSGPGRLPEPEQITAFAFSVAEEASAPPRDLEGVKVLISAGGTREEIDPVRFIGNHSSGRQGYALAAAAAQRGAEVTLVVGAVDAMPEPVGARMLHITSAAELHSAMDAEAPGADVVIMAAAVADYRPATRAESKMKKGSADAQLAAIEMAQNPDILAGLVRQRREGIINAGTTLVGFAAETGDAQHTPLQLGEEKLKRKGVDLLMVNHVGGGRVFGQDTNEGWLLGADGSHTSISAGSKMLVAHRILDGVTALRG
ncbi:Coenzyme A biosynthesis bifunctional protein CoaBC [Corynebacterium ciconiae DSM 44920]|uniref:bifunctional phosphopantothenoylcysteine decarboxylase/phosphopantothenate--cysteine ligase CoaBC n=1 Tax=Corynebacterium ciconiae TaxID=227319 RepID=UPI000372EA80|nr:bifunctional phosphopantothenoylcysteine decarboxylase/phosphopantothenate--cysteine ligase CoaBC [Corynebacterium ciconiae]WKD61294.1 Coenzyme A biosynthesis bifunctional protein CoaBC [Corynebacterium ciconiae DSM 44920]